MSDFDLWPVWRKYQALIAHGNAPVLKHDCGDTLISQYDAANPDEPVFYCGYDNTYIRLGLAKWSIIINYIADVGDVHA